MYIALTMLKVKLYCVGRAFNENSCFVDSDFKLSSVSVAMFIILNANSTRKTRHLSGPESGLFTRFNKNWFPPRLKLSSLSWLVILWSCFRHEPVSISLIIHSHFPHCTSSGLCCLKSFRTAGVLAGGREERNCRHCGFSPVVQWRPEPRPAPLLSGLGCYTEPL